MNKLKGFKQVDPIAAIKWQVDNPMREGAILKGGDIKSIRFNNLYGRFEISTPNIDTWWLNSCPGSQSNLFYIPDEDYVEEPKPRRKLDKPVQVQPFDDPSRRTSGYMDLWNALVHPDKDR